MLRCARAFEIESDPNFFQLTDSNIYDGRDAFFRRRDAETQRRRDAETQRRRERIYEATIDVKNFFRHTSS